MKHEVKILDLKVEVTTFEDTEIQVDVYRDGVEQTSGCVDTKELGEVDKDSNVDMETLLQTIDLTINGSEDECEHHLDSHYDSDLYAMETYHGWQFGDATARETLYWVIGKEIAFTMYLNGVI